MPPLVQSAGLSLPLKIWSNGDPTEKTPTLKGWLPMFWSVTGSGLLRVPAAVVAPKFNDGTCDWAISIQLGYSGADPMLVGPNVDVIDISQAIDARLNAFTPPEIVFPFAKTY